MGKTNGKSKAKAEAKAVTFSVRDGIAIVTIDIPGESVNTLGPKLTGDFDAVMTELLADAAVSGVVLISGKENNFIAGADIKVLETVNTQTAGTELSRQGQQAMQRLEDFSKPIVAAINGACLGGGLELALACHGRIATNHRKTKLGLPEVQLGLLPGAGGTQRLPVLIGIQGALDLILTGKQVDARKAKKLGLVDEVVAPALLERAAVEFAKTLVDTHGKAVAESPMDRVGDAFRSLFSSGEIQEMVLEDNPLGRKVLFDQANKKLMSKTRGNYPGPSMALKAVRTGATDGLEAGYQAESEAFGELLVSPEARQLMNIFFATTAMKKDTGVSGEVEPREVGQVGMLGAGLMGAGIAYVTAAIGKVPVRLKDRDSDGVGRGLAYVRDILDGRVKRRRMTKRRRSEVMAMVTGTTSDNGLANVPIVVEAVFEDLDLKRKVLKDVEARGQGDVIFASNTSTIPITRIAEGASHPELVIGMHYFSPVHKMPLLEIITTEKTADWVTATCVELGKKQGKTVIVVRDGVGFYTSRILGPLCNEAAHIMAEGVPIETIDNAMMDFGFPVGPLKLLDEVGIDVAHKAGGVVRETFGERLDSPPGIEKLIADKRFGRKNKRGFYLYEGKKKGVDKTVYDVVGVTPDSTLSVDEIQQRCALQMVNEAAHCFGEGILRSARDGDIGAIFGLGFPPFRGGPFRYVDFVGAATVVERLRKYEAKHGNRFTPAPILVNMAEAGTTFYGEGETREIAPATYDPAAVGVTASA